MNKLENSIEKLDTDLFAVNFELVANGSIPDLCFYDTSKEAMKKIVTISEDGCFIINKPLDTKGFQDRIDFVKSIMRLNLSDIGTDHGFCEWIKGISSRFEKYPDQSILKLRTVDPYKEFWIIYQNLCEAETKRRKLRKEYILSHPLTILQEFLNNDNKGDD